MRQLVILLAVFLMFPIVGQAQQKKPHTVESLKLRQQYKTDQQELKDFQTRVAKFNTAFSNENVGTADEYRILLLSDMVREIEQGESALKVLKEKKAKSNNTTATSSKEDTKDISFRKNEEDAFGYTEPMNLINFKGDKMAQAEKRVEEQRNILNVIESVDFGADGAHLAEEMKVYRDHLTQFEHLMQMDIRETLLELKRLKGEE